MVKFLFINLLSLGMISASLWANTSYSIKMDEILKDIQHKNIGYLIFRPELSVAGASYQLDKNQEYQIEDWYLRDWYELQDMFAFDINLFTQSYQGQSFNQAKRNQYSKFAFNRKTFIHQKAVPAFKEWGGLTHPPIKKLELPLEKYDPRFKKKSYNEVQGNYFSSRFQMEIDEESKSELTFNNRVKALADIHSFGMKKQLILEAKKNIFLSSLAFACDGSTIELINLLMRKKKEGVDVRVMVDAAISLSQSPKCLTLMEDHQIEVLRVPGFFKHNKKSVYHTKTLSIDLKKAIAGGTNMIDADNTSLGVNFKNRDVDLLIDGPMVTDVDDQFVKNWNYHLSSIPTAYRRKLSSLDKYQELVDLKKQDEYLTKQRGKEFYEEILESKETRMKGVCRFIKQAPHLDGHTIGKAYLKLLDQVKSHLVITDPIKTDSMVTLKDRINLPLLDKFDTFEMYNQLHKKVMSLSNSVHIDYITTNINMAGNEIVAILNESIKEDLKKGDKLKAQVHMLDIKFWNAYFGIPHYKNLLKDWVPKENVSVWTHISFMHSKIFYFDRIVASIGSLNFHHNATDHS